MLKIFCLLSLFYLCFSNENKSPYGLTCELLSNPESSLITNPNPAFGWIVNDSRRGARQTAYQILVASTNENIKGDIGDLWDSNKTTTDQSQNVIYNGKPLQENSSYWWKVKIWDHNNQETAYSEAQQFHTSMFNNEDRKWPGESLWRQVQINGQLQWVYENRHPISYHLIEPIKIKQHESGYFFDFGKAAFATLKINLERAVSQPVEIEVRLAEKLIDSIHVDTAPGASINYKSIVLKLEPDQNEYVVQLPRQHSRYPNSQVLVDHMPEVTPFRYAELVAWPAQLDKPKVQQMALFYQFNDTASYFHSSDEKLNQVWDLCKYSLKATPFLGLYADGTRERMPYEADAYIQQLGHYSVDREYAIARYTHEFLIYNPSWPTEWILHSVLIAWADYLYTGNTASLEKYYPELKHKTLAALAREDGLLNTSHENMSEELMEQIHFRNPAIHSARKFIEDIVDWPHGPKLGNDQKFWSTQPGGEVDSYEFRPVNTVVNAFHYRTLVLMSKLADVAGYKTDAQAYNQMAAKHKVSFNKVFFDNTKKYYVDGEGTDHASLHANMFALAFGLVPKEHVNTVIEFIKSRGMASSPYGAQYLLEALYEHHEDDYALELMVNETDRGWLNMIKIGSTITTEAWDVKYKPNFDWNHAWGAAPANIIPRKMMGIEPIEPSFKKFKIKPQPGNLQFVKIKTPSLRGAIACVWQKDGEGYSLEVVIPANSQCELYLPMFGNFNRTVRENSKVISKKGNFSSSRHISITSKDADYLKILLDAGTYKFKVD